MTQQRSVPPGWYDDPGVPAQLRWWDGGRWTERTQPAQPTAPPRPGRPGLGRGFDRLSAGLVGTLVLLGLINVVAVAFHAWASKVIASWLLDPAAADQGTARRIDQVTSLLDRGSAALGLLAFLLLVAWMFRAAGSDDIEPAALRHEPGWAIGGWFVPVLNLVRPMQMVQDVRIGAVRAATPSAFVPSSALIASWWGMFLVSRLGATLIRANSDTAALHGRGLVSAVARNHAWVAIEFGLRGAAAVLAALMVRSVTGALFRAREVRRGERLTLGVEARPSTGAAPR